jgi:8-hydroxy-5-deazaflavin:NADPH oxidoreductase
MEIGIIGAGMIGGTLARLLAERGHRVLVGTRTPDDPRLASLPAAVERSSPGEAAQFGIATIVAVPFSAWTELALTLAPELEDRVILDTSNAIPRRDGTAAIKALASGTGSGVAVAAVLPLGRVVKAFSTLHYSTLIGLAGGDPPTAIPIALPLQVLRLFLPVRCTRLPASILERHCSISPRPNWPFAVR